MQACCLGKVLEVGAGQPASAHTVWPWGSFLKAQACRVALRAERTVFKDVVQFLAHSRCSIRESYYYSCVQQVLE